jgi:ferredoxin
MHSYNAVFFIGGIPDYKRTDERLLENLRIFYKLNRLFDFIPNDPENPCIQCGLCESKCTQNLPVIDRIKNIYGRFEESGYNKKYIKERLKELFDLGCNNIALYPAGDYTRMILEYVFEFFPDVKENIFIFDKNQMLWGETICGVEIQNPEMIPKIKPDILIISNYMFENEIYDSLKHLASEGIKIVKLHRPKDVPWQF